MNEYTALICAAGEGKRLGGMTKDCPKALIPVGKKTMLEYMLDNLSACGIHDIVLLVGYKAETVINRIGTRHGECSIRYIKNDDFVTTDNLYSMWLARDLVKKKMLFFNADLLFHKKILEGLLRSNFEDEIVIDKNPEEQSKNPVVVSVDNGGVINKIAHQDDMGEQYFGVAPGIYKLSKSSSEIYFDHAREFFKNGPKKGGFFFPLQEMIKNISIRPFLTAGLPWASINTLEEYEAAVKSIEAIVSE